MTSANSSSALQAVRIIVGAGAIADDPSAYSIDGKTPGFVASPGSVEQLGEVMSAISESGLSAAPWGGGTQVDLGNRISRLDAVVLMSSINRVVQHNAADLTVTVEAGITLARLSEVLAEEGQFLALDSPVGHRATIGGTLAAGASGPLRWQYGSVRDLVIGMKVVQANGTITKSGGQVVKNVSGYDMARLHVGGLGTLGIIAEVSFKLTPLPRHQATVIASFDALESCFDAASAVFHSQVMPMSLTAFSRSVNSTAEVVGVDGVYLLAVRLGGRPATLERQVKECVSTFESHGAVFVEKLEDEHSGAVWRALADFGWDEATSAPLALRISVVPALVKGVAGDLNGDATGPSAAVISQPAYGVISASWAPQGGISVDDAVEIVGRVRERVHGLSGSVIVERCPVESKAAFDVWDGVGESMDIMRRMKEQYDPAGVLNPGRFVGGI
ncbi:MAG: FAD-binding oxidoreductase [Chloroflexi bacterium]|nr:FAD-binding oxidoreductase [Chloroflexota bacterium]